VLAEAGFDLVHAFDPAPLAGEPGLAMLADPARRCGWLVGNTRALWPAFVAARAADRELAAAPDPLDRYTERAIERAIAGTTGRAWLGHRRYDGAFVPLQRLAELVGLAARAPIGLAIHPVYGPWFALRAVVLGDGEPIARAPIARPCECGAACMQALARAQAARGPDAARAWLAVRDACPVGREHRYSEAQIEHHYAVLKSD